MLNVQKWNAFRPQLTRIHYHSFAPLFIKYVTYTHHCLHPCFQHSNVSLPYKYADIALHGVYLNTKYNVPT